jgi:hypothetical protein
MKIAHGRLAAQRRYLERSKQAVVEDEAEKRRLAGSCTSSRMQPTHNSKTPGYNPWKLYNVMEAI